MNVLNTDNLQRAIRIANVASKPRTPKFPVVGQLVDAYISLDDAEKIIKGAKAQLKKEFLRRKGRRTTANGKFMGTLGDIDIVSYPTTRLDLDKVKRYLGDKYKRYLAVSNVVRVNISRIVSAT